MLILDSKLEPTLKRLVFLASIRDQLRVRIIGPHVPQLSLLISLLPSDGFLVDGLVFSSCSAMPSLTLKIFPLDSRMYLDELLERGFWRTGAFMPKEALYRTVPSLEEDVKSFVSQSSMSTKF